MNKIKLAIDATATPQQLVGAGYYLKEILHELDKIDNLALNIFTRKNDGKRFSEFAPNATIVDIAPINKVQRVAFQHFKLGSVVDSLNVDVFHGPHYQIPKGMNTRSVVTIHDMTLLTHKDVHTSLKTQVFKRIIPSAIAKSKSIITVSQSTGTDVEKLFPHHPEIFIAPLGVDRIRFNSKKETNDLEILRRRGISGDYIAFLGLFEPRKSIPTLIEAFSMISEDFPNLKLVLAGSKGWGASQVKESIEKSGIATKIITPGRLSDIEVAPFLRNSKAFIYPSIYEGFGMPVLEAMACGAPTITTNSSSLKEVAGKGALLFEPGNVKELSGLISSLISNEKVREQMSKKALQRSNDFSWQKCAHQHLLAYEHALS